MMIGGIGRDAEHIAGRPRHDRARAEVLASA